MIFFVLLKDGIFWYDFIVGYRVIKLCFSDFDNVEVFVKDNLL